MNRSQKYLLNRPQTRTYPLCSLGPQRLQLERGLADALLLQGPFIIIITLAFLSLP